MNPPRTPENGLEEPPPSASPALEELTVLSAIAPSGVTTSLRGTTVLTAGVTTVAAGVGALVMGVAVGV
jgi:hypothetical protein